MTAQEERVRDLLLGLGLSFELRPVFELPVVGRVVLDFLVFVREGVVLECTFCGKKRGRALSESRRRCVFIDHRFQYLKQRFPGLLCGALVEAPIEDQGLLGGVLKEVAKSADFVVFSLDALRSVLRRVTDSRYLSAGL